MLALPIELEREGENCLTVRDAGGDVLFERITEDKISDFDLEVMEIVVAMVNAHSECGEGDSDAGM